MIKVNNVSMRFRMANDKIMSLKEYAIAAAQKKLKYKDFWVFHNISFEVDKGDVVGIIGRNGAGKSTLLKIISGVLAPTEGTVDVEGNIVPMLELGSGFDFELTGRENIFLNGSILGYNEDFLKEKYDEIVEFSELGEFIENPIRNYSSGMLMRLAFSIATIVQPEILIVDEILAVGDEAFQKKSKRKMLSLMGGGTTVLFVSHSMSQIREMCNKVAWIENGKLRMFGETKKVCDAYQEYINPDSKTNLESSKLYWNEVNKFCKDVLYVYGQRDDDYYWRVGIGKEQLLSTGITSAEVYVENLTLELAKQFRVFIFEKCSKTDEVIEFIQRVKKLNKVVLFDFTSAEEKQKDLLVTIQEDVDGIIVLDEKLKNEYSQYAEVFINPYVASDRIAQLATWANYDRDELPNINPDTIESEDMLINYNRAIAEKNKHKKDGMRIGCFNVELTHEKYIAVREKIVSYLKEHRETVLYTSYLKLEDVNRFFGDVDDQIAICENVGLEDMPRLFSQMDIVLNVIEENLKADDYRYQIIAGLVKVPFGYLNLTDGTYKIEKDIRTAYEKERNRLAIFSGGEIRKYILSRMTKNYAFLIDSSERKTSLEILRLAKTLYERGMDVVFLDNAEKPEEIIFENWNVPIVSRASKYIVMKYDVVVATMWKTFEFVKSYSDIVKRYYYVEKYETLEYDDGDYSKFSANQTYFSHNGIEILTSNNKLKDFFDVKYSIKCKTTEEIMR